MADKEKKTTTDTTTVGSGPSVQNLHEKQGEIEINKGADSAKLKEQSTDERFEDSRNQALENHAHEHEGDDEDYETLTQNDKPNGK